MKSEVIMLTHFVTDGRTHGLLEFLYPPTPAPPLALDAVIWVSPSYETQITASRATPPPP